MDFFTEQYISSSTDSQTSGVTPVSTNDAAQARMLFTCLKGILTPLFITRLFISLFFPFPFFKNNASFSRRIGGGRTFSRK
jgi:hypothetical protein